MSNQVDNRYNTNTENNGNTNNNDNNIDMETDENSEMTKRDEQTNNTSTEINKNNEMTNPNHTNNINIKINENNEMTKQNDNMETYDTNNDCNNKNIDTQLTTSNANNHIKTQTTATDNKRDIDTLNNNMIDIPPHLLTTFQILYRLKTRLSQLEATLENLQEHKRTNTVPTGLRIKHKNKFYMEKQLRERWDSTLSEASTALLDIKIEHHEQCRSTLNIRNDQSKNSQKLLNT